MIQLIILRHGESVWNKENRFTGWTDVDLSTKGMEEARNAGRILSESGFVFAHACACMLLPQCSKRQFEPCGLC